MDVFTSIIGVFCGTHIYQIIALYTLILYNVICQLCLITPGVKRWAKDDNSAKFTVLFFSALGDWISLRYTMPWQAMIVNCGSQICSGSIVSSSWVLTAAHCVRNM